MFLGMTADVVYHSTSESEGGAPSYSLLFTDNPLAMFVELPDAYLSNDSTNKAAGDDTSTEMLEYNQLYCGLIRGALEMLNMRVECHFVKSTLKGDDANEIRIQLKEVVAEGAGAEYQEE